MSESPSPPCYESVTCNCNKGLPGGCYLDENCSTCYYCPAGTYSTIGNQYLSCYSCPLNTYSTVGSTACLECPPNSVAWNIGSSTCTCHEGYISTGSGPSLSCTPPDQALPASTTPPSSTPVAQVSTLRGLPCNIPRIGSQNGIDWLSLDSPVIFLRSGNLCGSSDDLSNSNGNNPGACPMESEETDADMHTKELKLLGSRDNLLANHGNVQVGLHYNRFNSEGDSLPIRGDTLSLEQYITNYVDVATTSPKKLYLFFFGANNGSLWDSLNASYVLPQPCNYCNGSYPITTFFGIGGKHSGAPFHAHDAGFSETIIGTKRWFLFDPSLSSAENALKANLTTLEWVETQYPSIVKRDNGNKFFECTTSYGEILYVPPRWRHAVLNLDDYNFFVTSSLMDVKRAMSNDGERHTIKDEL